MDVCPVVKCIKEIKGGAAYTKDKHAASLVLGGGPEEYICDETSYHIMLRKITVSRFELTRPESAGISAMYKKMFAGYPPGYLYHYLIDKILDKKYPVRQFVRVIDIIGEMEKLIMSKIAIYGKQGLHINVSLGDIVLDPTVYKIMMYRPDILQNVVNSIVNYTNKLNVNAILKQRITSNISLLAEFTHVRPAAAIDPAAQVSTMEELKAAVAREVLMCEHLHQLEVYHCTAVGKLGEVYSVCKKIITDITD